MKTIVVCSKASDWPEPLPGVETVTARDYLTDLRWPAERHVRVINLCRSYRYQHDGYYVSLLAAARRHRPFPDLMTVLDMKSRHVVRTADEDLEALIQKSLEGIESPEFVLSVYFGKNLAQRHARLAARLASLFPAPLLRAQFRRGERWKLTQLAPLSFREVPGSHRDFMLEAGRDYLSRAPSPARVRRSAAFDLAILSNPEEELAPSDPAALGRFERAARKVGFDVEFVKKEDYGRLSEFDALFIRETTRVDHHTFRFAQRAEAAGLVVIDDPTSILRCTNKVYQAEALQLRGIAVPETLLVDSVDVERIEREIGLPCVLKSPDSSFSQGVVRCNDRAELEAEATRLLEASDLLVVQEYLPTEFDWRIGLFDGAPLYACRYHMAGGHWQVVRKTSAGSFRYGKVEPVRLEEVPERVVKAAVRAAKVIGNGLYGVDIKVVGRRVVVTEVNDNPNIDAGCEDAVLKNELYERIMRGMRERVEAASKVVS